MNQQTEYGVLAPSAVLRAIVPLLITWLAVLALLLVPLWDSTRAPYVGLDQWLTELLYWLTTSGGKEGVPYIALLALIVLVSRRGQYVKAACREAGLIFVIVLLCAGLGAAANEYMLKETLKVPRPNVVWLAGSEGAGPLGMTPEQFYAIDDHHQRSLLLAEALDTKPRAIALSESIKSHWLETLGYSFPSGHSYAVFFVATFFLMLAASYIHTRRIYFFYALLPWALLVCYSRSILRVHTPTDIAIGSLQGIVVGLLAWWLVRLILKTAVKRQKAV